MMESVVILKVAFLVVAFAMSNVIVALMSRNEDRIEKLFERTLFETMAIIGAACVLAS